MLIVESNFHPGGGGPFGRAMFGWGAGEPARKRFLYLSGEYFRHEMQREFRLEALAFVAIVMITAWPLFSLFLMLVG
jgi:hypothetical protein